MKWLHHAQPTEYGILLLIMTIRVVSTIRYLLPPAPWHTEGIEGDGEVSYAESVCERRL